MEGTQFAKMAASGNDFVVIDNRNSVLNESGYTLPKIAQILCERKMSIGADGMLLIENSKKSDFKMRIFNPDGSEVNMCGNGSRCIALYAVEEGITGKDMNIETGAGIIDAEVVGLRVKVKLTNPKNIKLNKSLKIGKKSSRIHFINTGVPHAVSFVNKLDKLNVHGIGSKIRYHRSFKPKGTNADFVKVLSPKEIALRTYERGVEAETYACGTGAAASAIIANLIYGYESHIDVHTKSREVLRIYFSKAKKAIKDVYLEGEAKVIYRGRIGHVHV